MSFCGSDNAPGKNQLACSVRAYQAREILCATEAGDNPKTNFGKAEFGLFGSIDKVTGQRQFQTTSKCKAVDGGDNRLAHLAHQQHQALPLAGKVMCIKGGYFGHLLDISPSDKSLVTRSGHNHRLD